MPATRAEGHRSFTTFWHRMCRLRTRGSNLFYGATHDLFHQSQQAPSRPVISPKPAVSYRPGCASGYGRRMLLGLLVGALQAALTGYAVNHVRAEPCVTPTLAESSEYEAARCRVALYTLFGRETSMYRANTPGTFLGSLFCATALMSGCYISSLGPVETVSMVVVTFDSTPLLPGGTTQASATATDAFGNDVPARGVTWRSLNTSIATVTSDGQVTALAPGFVLIEGKVATVAGSSLITVNTLATSLPVDGHTRQADMISASFDDGTLGGFGTWAGDGKVSVIDDPTGAGRGKVAKLRYTGSDGDDNTTLVLKKKVGFGQSIFFRGEFYIPVADLGSGAMQRKLIYFKQHEDWTRYPTFGGNRFSTVVKLTGNALGFDVEYKPLGASAAEIDAVRTYGTIATGLKPMTWYTLEAQQTNESSIGAGNGVLRIWLDGTLVFEKTNMRFSDPAWTHNQSIDDIYWDTFMVGQQVNLFGASYNEYRYWNDVAFSSQRIGK